MADSNTLILLPPAHTAQPPQTSSASQPAKSTGDETFDQKLQKAQKKVTATVKKQVAEAPAKATATAVKSPVAKTVGKTVSDQSAAADAADTTDSAVAKQPKAVPVNPDESASPEEDQPASTDSKQLPVLEDQAIAATAPVEKKPVKIAKAVAAKTDQPVVDPKLVVAQHPQQGVQKSQPVAQNSQEDSTAATTAKSPDAKAVVTAVGDQDSADDTPAGDGEFGTGKVVQGGASGRKNPADSSAQAGDSQDASDAANAAALPDAAALDATPQAEIAPAKTAAHSATQIDGLSTDISGVGLAVPTANAAGIIGKAAQAAATPQAQFVEDNHPKIISSIQGQLLPNGGTLQMKLDPPDLGALQVTVNMRNGVMTASFETSNDEATKLLSHSMGQLKSGLEAAGVSVEKIQVQQAPKKDAQGNSDDSGKQPPQEQQQQAQQDQQRREMVQRMWRKLAGGEPLDLVA